MRCYPTQEMRYANYPSTTDCELLQPHLPMVFFLPFIRTNYLKTAKQMERESKSTTETGGIFTVQCVCVVLCCAVCCLQMLIMISISAPNLISVSLILILPPPSGGDTLTGIDWDLFPNQHTLSLYITPPSPPQLCSAPNQHGDFIENISADCRTEEREEGEDHDGSIENIFW